MFRIPIRIVLQLAGALWLLPAAGMAAAQTPPAAKAPVNMERSEHAWSGGGRSSRFDVHWQDGDIKMIREEFAPSSGLVEKNEFFFNAGTLLHYKHDRYPGSGAAGDAVALMVSFDKSGNPLVSMKRVGGKPVGAASPAEIAQARRHLDELLAIVRKARP